MAKKQKTKKRENSIYSNFKDSWRYVKENRNYIYFAIAVFVLFLILAIIFPVPVQLDAQIKLMIQKLVLKTENLSPIELVSFIFVNNLGVGIIAVIFGVFLAIAPFMIAASNGYVLGYVVKLVIGKIGLGAGIVSLWRLLPHGIFELPAIFIGLGVGMKLGVALFSSLNRDSFKIFIENFLMALKVIIYVIIPLLVIAAFIEGSLIKLL